MAEICRRYIERHETGSGRSVSKIGGDGRLVSKESERWEVGLVVGWSQKVGLVGDWSQKKVGLVGGW